MNTIVDLRRVEGMHRPVSIFFVGVGQADAMETFCRRRQAAKIIGRLPTLPYFLLFQS